METNVIRINAGITINVDVSVKNVIYVKKYFLNPFTCSCESGKYSARIMDDSAVMYYEVIESYNEEIKTIPTNFNEKKAICKTQNFYIFVSYYRFINSCRYLLLSDKILRKTKTFITISRHK